MDNIPDGKELWRLYAEPKDHKKYGAIAQNLNTLMDTDKFEDWMNYNVMRYALN